MRFVVTHYPLREVDIRLADETKEKLKKAFYFGVAVPTSVAIVAYYAFVKDNDKKTSTEN